ncbi:MAG: hypothetical protein JO180_09380 [Gemmatirosa sp.]|nr:hypothetical protein [Gemmatirosa sp.]
MYPIRSLGVAALGVATLGAATLGAATLGVAAALAGAPRSAAAQAPIGRPVGAVTSGSVASAARTASVAPPAADTAARPRNPHLAAVLSALVPGAGQAYAGEPGRGLTLLMVAGGGLVLARQVHGDAGNVGAIVSMGAYVYAIIDAPAAVHRVARRAARRAAQRHAPAADGVRASDAHVEWAADDERHASSPWMARSSRQSSPLRRAATAGTRCSPALVAAGDGPWRRAPVYALAAP